MPVTLAQWSAHKRRRAVLWPSAQVFWNDFTIFVLGSAGAASVKVVGDLPGAEIVAAILLPFLLATHGKRAFRREYLWFYILLVGWLLGTIGGDLYLGTSLTNKLKGIARVVYFGADFIVLAILIDKKTRGMIAFALSIAVIFATGAYSWRQDFSTMWKYGVGYSLSIVVLLVSSYFYRLHRYSLCILISLCLAASNLILAYRSQVAVDLISTVLILPIFLSVRPRTKGDTDRPREVFRVVILLGLAGMAAYGANQAVKYAVSQNLFSDSVEQKFEAQSAGRLGVLVGGRPETLVAIQAIIDSPIIGHGSFAVDPKYTQMMQDIQYNYDYTDSDELDEMEGNVDVIPTHSHLTMAWVDSGILGGIFWIYIFALTVRGILRLVLDRPAMAPLYSFLLISFTWDIFYSPMGSVNRIIGAFYILISYNLLNASTARTTIPRRKKNRPIYAKTIVRYRSRI